MTWWADLYDDWLAEQLLVRGEAEVQGELAFLAHHLGLAEGTRALDQCCGVGSLSLPLEARGVEVVGVDQAAGYVARADRDARARGLSATFFAADAREFVPRERVHGAFNWWTSFGYSPSDDDNARMLARAFEALVPGGRFALDTMNVPGVLRSFQRDVALRKQTPRGEVLLLRESSVDLARGMMDKRWTYFVGEKLEVEHRSSVRLYLPDAIAKMLRGVGFTDVELLGSTAGEAVTLDSPRLIALARRPS